jgi:NarL family two-component system response regulator LiaR
MGKQLSSPLAIKSFGSYHLRGATDKTIFEFFNACSKMYSLKTIFRKYRHIGVYGLSIAVLVFLLKWLQWNFLIVDNSLDIYIGLIAVLFTVLGIWIALQLTRGRRIETVVVKEERITEPVPFQVDHVELEKLKLTPREYEVLQLMVKGHSNAEIAESLFLSLSTIKTHASNLFVKMDVSSRTKAIEKAKRLRITE